MSEQVIYTNIKPEDFFDKDDSLYIRVKWFPETKSFRFEVKNNIEEKSEDIKTLLFFIRGMLECSLQNSEMMYDVGVEVAKEEHLTQDLTPEERMLFNTKVVGEA